MRAKIFCLAFLLFALPHLISAQTTIYGGTISADTTWPKSGSPYVVAGDIYIKQGVTLNIEPGVIVKFKNIASAPFINGTLNAIGTADDPIYFTSYKDDSVGGDTNGDGASTTPNVKDWDQIYLPRTGKINLAYAHVRYAGYYSGSTGLHSGGGEINISNSHFTNLPIGIVQESGSANITSSEFADNDIGLAIDNGTAKISNCRIYNNSVAGLQDYYGRPLDARNNWWGDDSGPYHETLNPHGLGNKIWGDNVLFDPWIGQAPTSPPLTTSTEETFTTKPAGFSSVAFIPGVEASFLYRQEPSCTLFNCENELWVPNRNDDARKLFMDTNGESIDKTIYTREVVDNAFLGFVPIYSSFIKSMNKMVSDGNIAEFKPLPYDWRFDLDKVISRGTSTINNGVSYTSDLPANSNSYLIAELQKLADNSRTGKVTIVTHSNGGLVVKALMQKLIADHNPLVNQIDKVILVATPQLGTPEAIPPMLHGANQALGYGFLLNQSVARQAVENMPSAYNLLPSAKYFDTVAEPVALYQTIQGKTSIDSEEMLQKLVSGQLDGHSKPAADDLATPNILNSQMLAKAQATHTTLDNWQFPTTTEVIQIAGWGIPTLKTTEYFTKPNCTPTKNAPNSCLDIRPVLTQDGDGTVVSPSATAVVGSNKTFYLDISKYDSTNNKSYVHKDIFEINNLQQEISNLVKDSGELPNFFSVTKPTPTAGQTNLLLSVHSPVSIDAYDNLGNHTGLITNPATNSDLQLIEENIPNSRYLNFGEGKYVVLPNSSNPYTVKLKGTGFGTFSFQQEEIGENSTDSTSSPQATTTISFVDIPVTPLTTASLNISSGTSTTMSIDIDGNDNNDFNIQPTNKFDPILYLKMMRKIVNNLDLKPITKKLLEFRIDNMIKLIERGKIKNVERRIKAINWANSHIHWQNRLVSQTDRELIIKMLNQLLDNLE